MLNSNIPFLSVPAIRVAQQFDDAINIIDDFFGADYARKNPALVSAVLQSIVAQVSPKDLDQSAPAASK